MSDLRDAARQALEALEGLSEPYYVLKAQDALQAALEQPEQEPVAWIQPDHLQKAKQAPFLCRVEPTQRWADFVPFYTHPPRREWRGLTEEEILTEAARHLGEMHVENCGLGDIKDFASAIEAALKERNA